ncbi:uncharacterized protein JNUCC1_02933 [Lentibacillus sp. JNUCC-1]|uniref:flagellar protein FlaG n=1 Tax=Lentibacillus sp. JNUCC-1 TaxID=2654513 RepID=UPI0012E75AD3|nr:flagellar protein FlaG [Lentibacillus sp. JNUCC-1]MUV39061.1 uncharacterized protein [Lentibacillus sp. JNUCC-1]
MKVDNAQSFATPLKQQTEQGPRPVPEQKDNGDKIVLHDEEIISTAKVETAVTKMNELAKPLKTDLKFQLHEDLNEYYVTVVNPVTHEVIKEIPPKKMLDMYAAMAEFMGLLVDEKV